MSGMGKVKSSSALAAWLVREEHSWAQLKPVTAKGTEVGLRWEEVKEWINPASQNGAWIVR